MEWECGERSCWKLSCCLKECEALLKSRPVQVSRSVWLMQIVGYCRILVAKTCYRLQISGIMMSVEFLIASNTETSPYQQIEWYSLVCSTVEQQYLKTKLQKYGRFMGDSGSNVLYIAVWTEGVPTSQVYNLGSSVSLASESVQFRQVTWHSHDIGQIWKVSKFDSSTS